MNFETHEISSNLTILKYIVTVNYANLSVLQYTSRTLGKQSYEYVPECIPRDQWHEKQLLQGVDPANMKMALSKVLGPPKELACSGKHAHTVSHSAS